MLATSSSVKKESSTLAQLVKSSLSGPTIIIPCSSR